MLEDHQALIRSGEQRRIDVLKELRRLGVDTVRVVAHWSEIAPRPNAARRPGFDAADPGAYPGFGPYDDLVERAERSGFRVLITIGPDAPRWATQGSPPITPANVNRRPSTTLFADFAAAVAKRYSGDFHGRPAVGWFSIWNEPNHEQFLKPNLSSPAIYRKLVAAALPRIRAAAPDARVLVGETAPVGRPGKSIGPAHFLRSWLCLGPHFRPLAHIATSDAGCSGFKTLKVDGYAHHPYGPVDTIPRREDVINLLAIRRLGAALDRAAAAGRLPRNLPIYSTEFGLQSNPPDPTVTTTLSRQAQLLNEKEEFSYRYPRLRSYSQYLFDDDPPRPGATPEEIWSGFQTGLRFADGRPKPALDAYRLPIVVRRVASGVQIWGRVRPGDGTRSVQLERRLGRRFVASGARVETDDRGYFRVRRTQVASYRFRAFDGTGDGAKRIGFSRVAPPAAS